MLRSAAATFFQADSSLLPGSSGLDVRLERIGLPLEGTKTPRSSPSTLVMLTGIWPLIEGGVGDVIQVYLGVQVNSPTDAPIYMGPYPFTIGTTEFIDTLTPGGRYGCVKFTSSGIRPWVLLGYELDFSVIGAH